MLIGRRTFLAGIATLPIKPAAAGDYPSGPVKVVIPYAAGGAGDAVFRLLVSKMDLSLGNRFIVENMPGAGGNIGTQHVARATPNGYTLLCAATNNFVINQYLFNLSFNPATELIPIMILANIPSIFYSNPSVEARDLSEFISKAKANPGMLNYASPGIGTTPHLNVERLKLLTGINIQHVPYPGAPQALNALLANEVQLYAAGVSVGISFVESARLRALAVGRQERLNAHPNIPTLAECGIPNFNASNWFALAAPKGCPPEVISLLHDKFSAAASDPEIQKRFEELGFFADNTSTEKLTSNFAAESQQWSNVIRQSGLTAH